MHFGRQLVVAPPPRAVSGRAARAVLFGATFTWVGLLLLGMSTLFVWVFAGNSELWTMVEWKGPEAVAEGRVTGVRVTSSSENKRKIRGVAYVFPAGGREVEGESFTTVGAPAVGSPVRVQYLTERPEISRIEGLRRRHFSEGVGFVLLLPIVGTVFLTLGLRRGLAHLRLLRGGALGFAKLVDKRTTGARVNKKPVYALTFELETAPPEAAGSYRDQGDRREPIRTRFVVKTHETKKLEDEPFEPVLHDASGREGVPLDMLPISVTEEGEIDAMGSHLGIPMALVAILGLNLLIGLAVLA